MRIGLFTDTYVPDINGVANSTYILCSELRAAGNDVFVVAPKHGVGLAEWNDDHTILYLGGMTVKALYGYAITSPLHVHAFNMVKELDLDVIHVQTEFGVGIFARTCARQLGIPLVSTYHTTYEDYTHYANFFDSATFDVYAKKLVARLSQIVGDTSIEVIAPSEKTRELLERYHVHTKINVIPTGLDLQKFRPENRDREKCEQLRKSFGFTSSDIVFIYVGRIAEEKSVDIIIDGFIAAEQSVPEAKLLIIGAGPDLERMQERAKDHPSIILAGSRPIDEIHHYYGMADAFLSASLSETQGITFIEALASGIPIFVRRDEALYSLVKENQNGWYFAGPEDLAERVSMYCSLTEDARRSMGAFCTSSVMSYSKEHFCRKVLEVYEEAIWLYHNMWEVTSLRIKGETVVLTAENENGEQNRILMSLDDCLKEGIKQGSKLTVRHLEDLKEREEYIKAYQACLRRISVKDRTRYELFDWMRTHTGCSGQEMDRILDTLEEKGLIDDRAYCENAVRSMRAALTGRGNIVRSLKKKGVSPQMIEEVLGDTSDTAYADAYAEKTAASIHDRSLAGKRQKVMSRLIARGYDAETARASAESLDLSEDERIQDDVLRRAVQKARKRYERKQSGRQLKNMVYRYCMTQGFRSDDILRILEETEWTDNDENQGS